MEKIMKIEEMIHNISEMDVLKYICENLKNGIHIQYTLQDVDRNVDNYTEINGIVFRKENINGIQNEYWLMLEDGGEYPMREVMNSLKEKHLDEILLIG